MRLSRPSSSPPSPDKLYDQFIQHQKGLATHCNQARRNLLLIKKHAWRMASCYCQLQKAHPDYIQEMAASKVGRGGNIFDRWIDHEFAPLRMVAEDPRLLISLVAQGTSLAEYLAEEPALLSERRRRQRMSRGDKGDGLPAVPADPTPTMDPHEQITQLKAQNKALKDRCAELERHVAVLQKVCDKVSLQMRQLKIA